MWTLPEALLSPQEKNIKVYTRGQDGPAWEIPKKHFAAVVWDDPLISRQLVDHYAKNLDLSRHPVLLFVQGDKIKHAFPFNSHRMVRQLLFTPGEYELRILYDLNQNGVWDPGKFFGKDKRQPEKVLTIRKKMNVKANWDNDWDTSL